MLTVLPTRDTVSSGALESHEFAIKANGKAFKVLIDGLYSDKIRAVIRELWSNAYDSHIEAGRADVAFDCHLPTYLEPHFSVRDYGVSLSHHGVMKLYTTVFESTKEGTNATVGKLGLGSKSPFAYTDVFTVTARKDGKKRLYSAYIGSNYVPTIDFLGEEDSDEAQGLEISFPVKTVDVGDFAYAAQKTVNGFDVLPNTNTGLLKTTAEVLFSGPGWKLYRTTDYGHGAHARQGCVVYPLDRDAIIGLSDTQRSLLRAPIYIDFPIGELEITASREGLGYDAPTCANIVARLDAIEKDILAQFQAQFDGLKTYWEAVNWMNSLNKLNLPEAVKKILTKFQFKGRRGVTSSIYLDGHQFRKVGTQYTRTDRRGAYRLDESTGNRHLVPGEFYVFTIGKNEIVSAMQARINNYCELHGNIKSVFVVRADDNSVAMRRARALFSRMPTDGWIKISSLPKPDSTSVYVKKPVQAQEVTDNSFPKATIDLNAGGYYVPMERKEITKDGRTYDLRGVRCMIDALKTLGVIGQDEKVYAIPASLKRCYQKDGSAWVDILDLAKTTIDNSADVLADIGRLSELNSYFDSDNSRLHGMVKALLKDGKIDSKALPMGRFALYYRANERLWKERLDLKARNFEAHLTLTRTLNITITGKKVPDLYVNVVDKIMADYPMLALVFNGIPHWRGVNQDHAKTCLDYVLLVDGK